MDLFSLVGMLIVIGVCLGLLNRYGAKWIDGNMLSIINAVVVIAVILFILSLFFNFHSIHIGR